MNKTRRALILFTRVPEPGKTKTRLQPTLSAEECVKLHTAILKDVAAACGTVNADLFVCFTGPDRAPASFSALFPEGTAFFPQAGEGLGVRMERALRDVLEQGYRSALLFGSDVPEIEAEDLNSAFRILEQRDAVLGPTTDGGYWLIGLNAPSGAPFDVKEYSTDSVLTNTLDSMKAAGLTVGTVRERSDIDTPEDLNAFRERVRKNKALRGSHTAQFAREALRISVIVPMYNEEKLIGGFLEQLEPFRKDPTLEFLLADGGSTDRTLERVPDGWTVLQTPKGRACQMNTAAEQSTGDVLFFLHVDSEVPEDFPEEIREVMGTDRFGCFGIAYRTKDWVMHTNSFYANHVRLRFQHIAFGDQGIFVDRDLFFKAGKYPELPIMEDLQFSMNLRDMGVCPKLTKKRIYTSDRRHPEKGAIKQLISLHQYPELRKMYREGVPIEEIAKRYEDIR